MRQLGNTHLRIIMAALVSFLSYISIHPGLSFASTPEKKNQIKGLKIAQSAYQAGRGFGYYSVEISMKNTDPKGRSNNRDFTANVREVETGHNSRILVSSPNKLEGVSVLSYSYNAKGKDNDQWIYLPAQRKRKRLVSSNRKGSFLGSELSYDDLIPQEVSKFDYSFEKDVTCPINTGSCHVIRRWPLQENSEYKSQRVWIQFDTFNTIQVAYLNESGATIKLLENSEFSKQKEEFWYPSRTLVKNLNSNRTTLLTRENFNFDTLEPRLESHLFSFTTFFK